MGIQLEPGDSIGLNIDNFNRLYAAAEISGDELLLMGVAT